MPKRQIDGTRAIITGAFALMPIYVYLFVAR